MRDTSGQILICKDGGLLVKDDQRLQLSREQVKVLAACFSGRLDEREHALLLVDVPRVLWNHQRGTSKPLTPSRRNADASTDG